MLLFVRRAKFLMSQSGLYVRSVYCTESVAPTLPVTCRTQTLQLLGIFQIKTSVFMSCPVSSVRLSVGGS